MSNFFDFFKSQRAESNEQPVDSSEPVILTANEGNNVEVPAAEAAASTLGQLFKRYADVLGIDPSNVNKYTDAGRVVTASTVPTPGRVYFGAADSFTKGSRSDLPGQGQIDWLLR